VLASVAKIYLDNAATTPVDPLVLAAMKPFFGQKFGNASEPHSWGQVARKAIEESRLKLANFLGAKPKEIIFTSCATESINLAHKGLLEALLREFSKPNFQFSKKLHIITSSIEHKAVFETCRHLEQIGWAKVTYLPVDKYGLVSVNDVKSAIRPETVLISIMYVNNEVGTIEPIPKIGQFLRTYNKQHRTKIYFHVDATQAIQYLDCNVDQLGVDLLSLTGHKFYVPKGVGALYIRKGTPVVRQQDGGAQEYGLRSGTENVPYIVGLGRAVELISKRKQNNQIAVLRDELIKGILKIPGTKLTGHPIKRAPHIASFIIEGVEGEAILLLLSDKGIAASSGSACTSGSLEPSHVLKAMGIPAELAHGSIRFSLGKNTTIQDIDYVLKVMPEITTRLRKMAPKL
jgi:cysteine desulfurase